MYRSGGAGTELPEHVSQFFRRTRIFRRTPFNEGAAAPSSSRALGNALAAGGAAAGVLDFRENMLFYYGEFFFFFL